MEVDLNVALGLEDPPPGFDYSAFELDVGRACGVGCDESDEEVGCDSDCVIVDKMENDSLKNASSIKVDNDVFKVEDVALKDPKLEECELDDKDILLTDPKKEDCDRKDDNDVDHKDVYEEKKAQKSECDGEFKMTSDRRTAANFAYELEEKLSIGTEFGDLEKVYLLYCEYARYKGFSVRKGEQRYFGKTSNIRWKQFRCSCTGMPNYRSSKYKIDVYKKLITRSNCTARVAVSRDDMSSFVVSLFEKDHNHVLVDCDQTFLLRSSRQMNYAKKSVLEALNSVGVGVTAAFKFMAKESGGIENVGFTKKDAYHHMDRVRLQTKLEDADARLLLEYFSNKSIADPFFFYKYQLDDDGRLMNIFFRDNRCAVDYDAFGDVLSVDTTYRTNRYNMICAPFVGINHHTRNVMFGMALLSDETTGTFKWLFESFLQSMHGKEPTVIFTDQCRAMMNAIDVVFPNSKHRLCQWHILKNCASNFGKLHGDSSFKSLWYKCMNIVESEEDFNKTWKAMMENFEISNKSWFDGMHNLRQRWASCFSRGIFTAGLLATSRSELTNKVLKDVVRSTVALSTFVHQYDGILNTWRSTERMEDTYSLWNPGQSITNSGLLQRAATVFTRTIYKQFEHDYANCLTLIVDPKVVVCLGDNNFQYTAIGRELSAVERKVVINTVTHIATCDCGKWETEGLICRHILRVFVIENVNDLPDEMIYRRWTKRAKDLKKLGSETLRQESAIMRNMTVRNEFMRHMSDLVSTAMEGSELLRVAFEQRMKEVREEFSELIWKFVGSQASVKETSNLVVPLFRDPRKICPRGFANVRKSNPYPSKGRKRARKSAPNSSPASKRKVNPTSPPMTQDFMQTNDDKQEKDNDGDSLLDDIEKFWPLSL